MESAQDLSDCGESILQHDNQTWSNPTCFMWSRVGPIGFTLALIRVQYFFS